MEGISHVWDLRPLRYFEMTNQQANYRGRVRGLITVWEEVRWERNILWISTCPTLGHDRAATLTLWNEMVAWNTQAPELRHPKPMGRGLPVLGTDDGPNSLAPSRMRARNPGPIERELTPCWDFLTHGHSDLAEVTPHHISPYWACPIPKSYQLWHRIFRTTISGLHYQTWVQIWDFPLILQYGLETYIYHCQIYN